MLEAVNKTAGYNMKRVGAERARSALMAGIQAIIGAADDPTMPIQQAVTFLAIAGASETPQTDLIEQANLSSSAVSRNVARLAQGESLSKPGLHWVESYEDPAFRKRKLVRLTARGRTVADSVIRAVQGVIE